MKAIKITEDNRASIGASYTTIDEPEEQLPVGYYLVADFGNDETFDLISVETLNSSFVIVGELENGYIQIERV